MIRIFIIQLLLFISIYGFSQNVVCSSPTIYIKNKGIDFNNSLASQGNNLSSSDNDYNCIVLNKKEKIDGYFVGFNFSIPNNAIITNIDILIEGYWLLNNGCKKSEIRLYNNGINGIKESGCSIIGNNGIDDTTIYTDNSLSLTPSDVNDSNFGLKVKFESNLNNNVLCIDYIEICITYDFPLPTKILEKEIYDNGDYLTLYFSTSDESSIEKYYIYKFINGLVNYGTITPKKRTLNKYYFNDYNIKNGLNYYVLYEKDVNGDINKLTTFKFNKKDNDDVIFNIKKKNSFVEITTNNDVNYILYVYDISGKLIIKSNINIDKFTFKLNVGLYIFTFIYDNKIITFKEVIY
jgi:hypothetical protein